MREKDLRLALVCYGGISLAVYMHGITKEIWHVARASAARQSKAHQSDGLPGVANSESDTGGGSASIYIELLAFLENTGGTRLKVIADIVAGASAGGINGIFLARAIATGQSLEPLTQLWLETADVDQLLDSDARPLSRFSKYWALPIAWLIARRPGNMIEKTVEKSTRAEVRQKLSQFVRARWFAPPFGGQQFCNLLLKAFAAMDAAPPGPPLVPPDHPVDLIVTVTDFYGHKEPLVLNSPSGISEVEHRLAISFRQKAGTPNDSEPGDFADAYALAFAARATASFPGAFPPFTVRELDHVLARRSVPWPARNAFLARILPRQWAAGTADDTILIDGSVLANAPFRPAIAALRNRSARREVDRRFVYIDPKPDMRSIGFGAAKQDAAHPNPGATPDPPGFFRTIFGALSDIPREQPIRDNIDMLEGLSTRIRRVRRVIDALEPEVDERVQKLFGRTLFLDSPTPARLAGWRTKAQSRAATDAGFAYPAYGHLKLSQVAEALIQTSCRLRKMNDAEEQSRFRRSAWVLLRDRGLDRISPARGDGASLAVIAFFKAHDLNFRIRRLRHVTRRVDARIVAADARESAALERFRATLYSQIALYLDRDGEDYFHDVPVDAGPAVMLDYIADARDLNSVDAAVDAQLAQALAQLSSEDRRIALLAYLGFPFIDIATLALGEGDPGAEIDTIKIDRISPEDARAIRSGGAAATLKGTQFNSFGAFFSAAYRENDYLWGRLHGADRLVDIVASSVDVSGPLAAKQLATLKRRAFLAILDEEAPKLRRIAPLIAQIRLEIG